ncbi:alanine racemase [Lentibacillus halodurans]|uniref:Alanine racemase n=1 Tax=Lentibacillus halodurans TaxID=237679 RepID=A0A1I1AR75_9BACI|nr:alanine racemase [Lentibacillus halodurans]SFB38850.1 alanine racemase [Lentibacillus halodurans]
MERKQYRGTWAEVDLDAIGHNINQMKKRLPEHCAVIAVVKANAYGHGSVEVAEKALASGAKMLAVALLEEALILREANITAPILVFGSVSPRDVPVAARQDITLTCFQLEWIRDVKQLSLPSTLNVHMKWDTGMGRVGLRTKEELLEMTEEFRGAAGIHLTGIYTHFATADEADISYFQLQQNRFDQLLDTFKSIWNKPVAVHVGNSAASIRFPEKMYDYMRFGISMYGLYPSDVLKDEREINLKPAFSLYSRLIHVKRMAPGESISYGATYTTGHYEYIGTIPIGYADGWIRKLQGMDVLVDGKRMPIVGRITMDQTMIKLDQEYPVGSKVTLIGKQWNDEIETDELAAKLETINYEIPCMISERVPRLYKSESI